MVITAKDVEHISKLACIDISEKEKELFEKQFNSILDYFKELDGVNTENVEPTYHVIGLNNVFREDEATESLSHEEALRNTARTDKGYFKGPRIV
ncbi:Asp-tRNA(Asn)/Glu-tRNA(Gln) amidotransferase GatCAB subunit C [Methanocella sp. CWC-04]|uniref:Aspartyl/glutamyl-tRNA(Asn/Gln) amidotransferase subunit C n=1 Tax=Methanooceanicella nereidis TaxID=2052831 RepID=A0AAP2W685_9EURY|nr:Asp-tRNA(Asn)/Glu-tRNA(Gln) amidotransferase subunit GatC [Methanocella sp. CWC-04]MCD1293816.1 Asp-tRNA(Asn)/Glu-tRNA(Gln) amidotransferase GatCAB subunit C [Methanocella sp. CWC-04]